MSNTNSQRRTRPIVNPRHRLPAAVAKELPPNRLLFQKSDTLIRHPPMLRIKLWISKSNKTKRRSKHISALKIFGPALQLVRCAGNICLRSPARGLRGQNPRLPTSTNHVAMHICCCTLPKQMRTMHARLPRVLLEIPRFAKTLGTALFCLLCCFFSLLCCRFRCPCYSHSRNKMPVHIPNSKCETPADVQASASSEAKCRRLRLRTSATLSSIC